MADRTDYDLFASYSRWDNRQGRVSELVGLIRQEYAAFTGGQGLQVFFDQTEIRGMDDWRHRILRGIRSTRLLLVFLSPAYLESAYCAWEVNEYLKQEAARALLGEGIAPIYFSEIPGWSDKGFEQRSAEWVGELRRRQQFDFRPWFDEGFATLKQAAVKALLQEATSQIHDRVNRIHRVIEAKGNVDRHNEHFVGRTAELRRVREVVALKRVGVLTAVNGLGGVGKTALAVEYAHAYAHEYPGGRWQVRCEGREDLRAVLSSLAGASDLAFEFTEEQNRDLDLQFERVLAELKRRAEMAEPRRVLLILDNVDVPKLLEPAQVQRIPQADWLHVIATTRLGTNDLYARQKDRAFLAVDELSEEDALALMAA